MRSREEVGKELLRLQRASGMTQVELSEKLGYSARTIYNDLHFGTYDLEKIQDYADVFGVALLDILFGTVSDENLLWQRQDKYDSNDFDELSEVFLRINQDLLSTQKAILMDLNTKALPDSCKQLCQDIALEKMDSILDNLHLAYRLAFSVAQNASQHIDLDELYVETGC